jgi:hypothetical protein
MQDDCSLPVLLGGEEILGEERVLHPLTHLSHFLIQF